MPTLAGRLDAMKWKFHEAGMHKEWNELKSVSNAANTTQLGDGVVNGTRDYATHCDPDVSIRGNPDETSLVRYKAIVEVRNPGRNNGFIQ